MPLRGDFEIAQRARRVTERDLGHCQRRARVRIGARVELLRDGFGRLALPTERVRIAEKAAHVRQRPDRTCDFELANRVGAPLVLVTTFGALLAWGYTGQSASVPRIPKEALPVANSQLQMTPASWRNEPARDAGLTSARIEQPPVVVEQISMDQARKTAAKFATGTIGTIAIIDTDAGAAIVAIDHQRRTGKTGFLLLEKRNGKYRVSSQQALDGKGFRHANWSAELVDADEDGFQELLFSGKDSSESRNLRRLVLFVPNDRRTYSMQMTGETTARGTPRIQWLANAAGTEAAAYRTALRQKARAIVSKKK